MTAKKGRDVSTATVSEERLERYMGARYGQRGETRQRYEAGIYACSDIFHLDKTITEIAREFGHEPNSFLMMMKRHYQEVLTERDRLRQLLGLSKMPQHGVRQKTVLKYEPALELLRTTDLTVREAAEKTGVSIAGLQQHIIFFHKELAQERLKKRAEALDNACKIGEISATGRITQPRAHTAEYYAKAVELCREHPELTLKQIGAHTAIPPHNLSGHLQRWHPDVLEMRERWRHAQTERRQTERALHNADTTKAAKAQRKYSPALPLIEQGMSYADIAQQLGLDREQLKSWVRHNHPELHQRERANNWVTLPGGVRVKRQNWDELQRATNEFKHSDAPLKHIAQRHHLSEKTLSAFLHRVCPEAIAARQNTKQTK